MLKTHLSYPPLARTCRVRCIKTYLFRGIRVPLKKTVFLGIWANGKHMKVWYFVYSLLKVRALSKILSVWYHSVGENHVINIRLQWKQVHIPYPHHHCCCTNVAWPGYWQIVSALFGTNKVRVDVLGRPKNVNIVLSMNYNNKTS